MIRISLVEPSKLWRTALSMVISREQDIEVASEFAHISEAIGRAARVQKTDVGVISIDMKNEHNNLAAAGKLKKIAPSCHILAVVSEVMAGSISPASGYIQGFVSHETELPSLIACIRRVAHGERIIEPASLAVAAACAPANPLTPRERQVLLAIINENTTREVATQLRIADGTVRNAVSSIIEKTGTSNRMAAIRVAQTRGWV
ncbi:MAG TPA: response regulator transcription factor [Candidatus Saccharimonadales bacterium]